jgi:hypothetical protein
VRALRAASRHDGHGKAGAFGFESLRLRQPPSLKGFFIRAFDFRRSRTPFESPYRVTAQILVTIAFPG